MPLTAAIIGFFSAAHVLHHSAGQRRKAELLLSSHFKQLGDDAMNTAAGAESFSGTREHDDLNSGIFRHRGKHPFQLRVGFKGQSVEPLRIVQANRRDAIGDVVD